MAWREEDHPRDPEGTTTGGRFTSKEGAARAGAAAREAAGLTDENGDRLLTLLKGGGFSESLAGKSPDGGFMVAVSADTEMKKPIEDMTRLDILRYIVRHAKLLNKPSAFLGGWLDEGYGYLDVSINVEDKAEALAMAKANKQLAIYDVVSGESIYLGEKR